MTEAITMICFCIAFWTQNDPKTSGTPYIEEKNGPKQESVLEYLYPGFQNFSFNFVFFLSQTTTFCCLHHLHKTHIAYGNRSRNSRYRYGFSLFSSIMKEEMVQTGVMELLKLEGEIISCFSFTAQKLIFVLRVKAMQIINNNSNHLVNTLLNLLYTYLLNK